ncbi:MAG: gamma-glutamyltransferase, partial [Bacteroidetes bacterium]
MKNKSIVIISLLGLIIFYGCESRLQNDIPKFKNGIVVSAHPLANAIGLDILKAGGNAFDAAVAVNMALAVTYPRAGNIGGGGFVVYRKANGEIGSLDYREKAPEDALRDMYLNTDGEVIENISRQGALSIGVPGTVAGMVALHEKFGELEWASLLKPSIELALNGFVISEKQAKTLNRFQETFNEVNGGDIYLSKTGGWKNGGLLKSIELANTLELIAKEKSKGFYEGVVAEDIVNTVKAHGGIITLNDLANYQAVWREPISGIFNGYEVISMPPPSSGGVALIQLLKGFEMLQGDTLPHNSALYIHLLT